MNVAEENVSQESNEENGTSPVTSVVDDDTGTATGEQSITMATSDQTDYVTLMEVATPGLLDSYGEDERAASM